MVNASSDLNYNKLAVLVEEHERHNQLRIEYLERVIDARMKAQALAVDKAAAAYDARFASANEFRQAMQDLSGSFATRDMVDQRLGEIERRLTAIESRLSSMEGRNLGQQAGIGFIVLIIALIAQVLGFGGG